VLYRDVFKIAIPLKVLLVTAAAMLAFCLMALAQTTKTASAHSLPRNGNIAFTSSNAIYTAEPDGSKLRQLTHGTPPAWGPI
jgi:hypothetical protein